MFDLINKTPIASLIPLGDGMFEGNAQSGNRTLSFVVKMTGQGQVLVKKAVFRVRRQAAAQGE